MVTSRVQEFLNGTRTAYAVSKDDARRLFDDIGTYDQRERLEEGLDGKVFILSRWEGTLDVYGGPAQRYRLEFRETGDIEPGLVTRMIDLFGPEREPISSFTIEGDIPPGYDIEQELDLEAR